MEPLLKAPPKDKVKKKATCLICKKDITDPISIKRGMGKVCYEKHLLKTQKSIKIKLL